MHSKLAVPAALLLASLWLVPAHAAAATSYVVNTNADAPVNDLDCAGGNTCTLRDAITFANVAGGTNQITFASTVTAPIVLSAGTLTISGQDLTIAGLGTTATVIDGNHASTVFTIITGATLTLSDATVQHGAATTTDGGGFNNGGTLNLVNDAVTNNTATAGGGFCFPPPCAGQNGGGIVNGGTLTLSGTTMSGNTATSDGGAIYMPNGTATLSQSSFVGNAAEFGAGVVGEAGTLTVSQDTFSANNATSWSGGLWSAGNTVVSNSTFYNNTSGTAGAVYGWGAGVLMIGGSLSLVNDTIVDNAATDTAGGLGVYAGSVASITNTLIAGNTPGNCYSNGAGTFTSSGGYNDDSDSSCALSATRDRHDGTPIVDTALRANGGPTQTLALLPGSPLIDAGSDSACASGAGGVDQRGLTRPQGAHCDIGAFEASASTTAVTAAQPTAGGDVTITATVAGPSAAAGAPQGSIAFTKNGAPIGSATLAGSRPATASITLSETDAADPTFAATYTPANGFLASSGSVDFTPNNGSTTPPPPPPPPTPTTPETGGGGVDPLGPALLLGGGLAMTSAGAGARGRPRRTRGR